MERREFLLGLAALGILGSNSAGAKIRGEFPEEGVHIDYRVLFGGNEIGKQTISFNHHATPGFIEVKYQINLEVRMLFAVAYRFEHSSTEIWDQNRKLHAIDSTSNENGKTTEVKGKLKDDVFHVKGEDGHTKGPGNLITSDSFWLAAALDSHHVMNTRTGDMAQPQVKKLSQDRYHLKAEFNHSKIDAKLHFKDEILYEAEIDSDGHSIRFERIS